MPGGVIVWAHTSMLRSSSPLAAFGAGLGAGLSSLETAEILLFRAGGIVSFVLKLRSPALRGHVVARNRSRGGRYNGCADDLWTLTREHALRSGRTRSARYQALCFCEAARTS